MLTDALKLCQKYRETDTIQLWELGYRPTIGTSFDGACLSGMGSHVGTAANSHRTSCWRWITSRQCVRVVRILLRIWLRRAQPATEVRRRSAHVTNSDDRVGQFSRPPVPVSVRCSTLIRRQPMRTLPVPADAILGSCGLSVAGAAIRTHQMAAVGHESAFRPFTKRTRLISGSLGNGRFDLKIATPQTVPSLSKPNGTVYIPYLGTDKTVVGYGIGLRVARGKPSLQVVSR